MRNKSIIMLLIFIILLFNSYNLYAYNIEVTRANLSEALKEHTEEEFFIDFIELTENQMITTRSEQKYYSDYSLSDNPTFSTKIEISKDTPMESLMDMKEKLLNPVIGYIGISMVQGNTQKISENYVDDLYPFKEKNYVFMLLR